MTWRKNLNPAKYKHSQYVLALLLLGLLIVVGLVLWSVISGLNGRPSIQTTGTTQTDDTAPVTPGYEQTADSFDSVVLQSVIDDWLTTTSGASSVVISSSDNELLAAHNPDDVYFAASIYKLYVAYAGYQQVDDDEVDPSELYINGYTRLECLDAMVRDSDSPCAEKLWNELGKQELTNQLIKYGINNTSMTAVTTTALDASVLLGRIIRGEGLSEASKTAYLDSMKDQEALYRRGLPSGFTLSTIFNKVGWNELVEWHDTAIVELSDGRTLIVTVFTENVGFQSVARLGAALESALQ